MEIRLCSLVSAAHGGDTALRGPAIGLCRGTSRISADSSLRHKHRSSSVRSLAYRTVCSASEQNENIVTGNANGATPASGRHPGPLPRAAMHHLPLLKGV